MSLKTIVHEVNDVFSLWDPIVKDNSIIYYDYNPIAESNNVITQSKGGVLQAGQRLIFRNTSTADKTLYSRSFINIMAQIVNSTLAGGNWTPVASPANALLSNNFPMFDQSVFKLSNTPIESNVNLLREKNLLKNLLDFSDNDKYSFTTGLWAPDSGQSRSYTPSGGALTTGGPGLAIITPTVPILTAYTEGTISNYQNIIEGGFNGGALQRYKFTWSGTGATTVPPGLGVTGNGIVNLRIPAYRLFDFLEVDKFYSGVVAQMELVVGDNQQNLFQQIVTPVVTSTAANANTITYTTPTIAGYSPLQLQIQALNWMLPVIRPTPNLDNELMVKMSENRITSYSYRYCEPQSTSYTPQGLNTINWLLSSTSDKMEYALFGFRWSGLINDPNQINNTQVFHNILQYITNTWLQLGGDVFPVQKYQPQMISGSSGPIMLFNKLLDITNRTFDYEGGMALNWNKFYGDGVYSLIPFDCRYTDTNAGFQAGQTKEMRYLANFTSALGTDATANGFGTLNVYCFPFTTRDISLNLVNGGTQLIS